jgi:hypothetical protein
MKPPIGNGSGKFEINAMDMCGWVRVSCSNLSHAPDDLPIYLSHSLADWFRSCPNYLLQFVVPMIKDGKTVELHGFYLLHLVPPIAGPTAIRSKKQ